MAYVFLAVSCARRLDVKTANASRYLRLSGPGGLSPQEGGDLDSGVEKLEIHLVWWKEMPWNCMMGNVGCCKSGYLGLSCTDQDDSFFNLSCTSRPTLWRSVNKSLERPFNVCLSLSISLSLSHSGFPHSHFLHLQLPPIPLLVTPPPPSLSLSLSALGGVLSGGGGGGGRGGGGGWGACTDMCAPPLHNVWIIAGVKWIWTCSQCWEVEEVRAAAHICRTAGRSDAEDFCWKR